MIRRVYKYDVPIDDAWHDIVMPHGATLLHVSTQSARAVTFWAEVDERYGNSPRRFRVFGTGQPIPEACRWVGTTQAPPYVWHLYEEWNRG